MDSMIPSPKSPRRCRLSRQKAEGVGEVIGMRSMGGSQLDRLSSTRLGTPLRPPTEMAEGVEYPEKNCGF